MNAAQREAIYGPLARLAGLVLVVLCVLFQRRGLLHWSELAFLGICIGMQETFLRLNVLRRLRGPMLAVYSMLPLGLVLLHAADINAYRGDFVQIVLNTPLPLVLVSVQIMVLYVKDSPRLVSVVLVLALFSVVIGVRRPIDDSVWPWLAMIGASGAIFLMLQHPGMLFHGVYVNRRHGTLPPTGRPGGVIRGSYFSVLPFLVMTVLVTSLFLYFTLPRFERSDGDRGGMQVANNSPVSGGGGPSDTGGRGDPRDRRDPALDRPASVSGLAAGVDLGDFGEIKRSRTPALNVQIVDPEIFVQRVYLRAYTYGTFDGSSWKPLDQNDVSIEAVPEGPRRELPSTALPFQRGFEDRRYRITILEAGLGSGGQLPLPPEPFTLQLLGGPLQYSVEEQIARAPQARNGDTFEVTSRQLIMSQAQMERRLNGTLPDLPPRMEYLQIPPALRAEIQRRFNQVAVPRDGTPPPEGLFDRFQEMANSQGAYVTAAGIADMFHEATSPDGKAWVYSLDFRPEPGVDAIARFLDTTNPKDRVGHCEYFATAMCMLLRCYDIPSRVVAGFHATKPNERGVFEVDSSSAHAWVEVWVDGYGWLTFDPTPGEDSQDVANPDNPSVDPVQEPEPEPDSDPLAGNAPDGPEAAKGDWIEGFDEQRQRQFYRDIESRVRDGLASVDRLFRSLTAWLPSFLPDSGVLRATILATPLLALLMGWLVGRRRRKRIEAKVLQQMGEGGNKRQRGLYMQLLVMLAKHGFQKRSSETPREFAERVLRKGGETHAPIIDLTETYYALRFGSRDGLEEEFRKGLGLYTEALKAARSSLRGTRVA